MITRVRKNWTQKRVDEVFRKWKANEISLQDAAAELIWLGWPAEKAWSTLQNT